ncbi:hypothetical protein BJ322DRAFT_829017 [Thelephora terrestris]|uniref:Uncharacterized protein n=1 Tax=Thelephora terrestris TaxID=56493 RepID=A0A9P6HG34_9AGAM|nr:hypothetical protein BJ322DRAFT_829017 [Thelephora terrestris]
MKHPGSQDCSPRLKNPLLRPRNPCESSQKLSSLLRPRNFCESSLPRPMYPRLPLRGPHENTLLPSSPRISHKKRTHWKSLMWHGVHRRRKNKSVRFSSLGRSRRSWKSIFFYRCTDEISFAPLRSQGVVSRANYIREKTVATAPPPCSPKSIYVLAELLGIPVLREKAFEDFKKKVTSKTVVGEAFSWVTAGQKEILEMECDLLVSSSKGPSTVALVKDSIRRASDGSSPHCAGALKLGLEKAFKSKKESNGVKLRCSHSSCNWYSNHVSYSSIGSGTYQCQMCINRGWGGYYFQCAGCGYNRTSNHTACQGCGKRFL